jgi:hypothetical protein
MHRFRVSTITDSPFPWGSLSPVGRALLAADAVDRVVVDVVRDPYRPAPDDCLSVGLPDRFQIASIITTHHAIRLIGRRSMRAEG